MSDFTYEGVRRVSGLRKDLAVPQKTPHRSTHPTLKKTLTLLLFQTPTLWLRVLCTEHPYKRKQIVNFSTN